MMRSPNKIMVTGLTAAALVAGAGQLNKTENASAKTPAVAAERADLKGVCNPALEVRALTRHIKRGDSFKARVLVPRYNESSAVLEEYVDHIGDDPVLRQLVGGDPHNAIRGPFMVQPLVLCARGVNFLAALDQSGKIHIERIREQSQPLMHNTRFLVYDTKNHNAFYSDDFSKPDNPLSIGKLVTRTVHLDPNSTRFGLTDVNNPNRVYGTYVN